VIVSSLGRRYTAKLLEMAAAASGGEDELRRRPWVMVMMAPISPLQVALLNEGILEAAALDVPILYSPGPMMGATGPATVAGTLAQSIAESLFGLVLSQLIKPGIPFVLKPDINVMDMVTGQCTYGSAEQSLGRAAMAQLCRLYNLPTFTHAGGAEAKLPDAEAAAQAMMGMLLDGLAGVTLTQTMGTLASGKYGSVEMLVICDEIAHMIKRVLAGISVTDDTLALDVIREVGPGGHFLDHDHRCATSGMNSSSRCCSGASPLNSGWRAGVSRLLTLHTSGSRKSWQRLVRWNCLKAQTRHSNKCCARQSRKPKKQRAKSRRGGA